MHTAPTINAKLCSGCGRCVAACHLKLITLEVAGFRKTAVSGNRELCVNCRECANSCLLHAFATD